MTDQNIIDAQIARMIEYLGEHHKSREQRVAIRCGLHDATTICDLLAKQVTAGKKRVSKQRQAIAAALKEAGDTIWKYRDQIDVPAQEKPNA